MKAVFLDRGSFPDSINFDYPATLETVREYPSTEKNQVLERIQGFDIVLSNKVQLSADILAQASSVKLILVTATGTNNVDLEYCQQNNILVKNVTGYSINSVPEHTFSLLLALKRNLIAYSQATKNGDWEKSDHFCFHDFPITDLAGSNLVIFGKGALGNQVAKIAEAFGMKTFFSERKHAHEVREGYIAFDTALEIADVISFHCPLTDDNKHMIDNDAFSKMKANCVLINTGRGGLVDEAALARAIKTKQIAGAGFDVASVEPMPSSHLLQDLSKEENFILTPHVAWASHDSMQTLANTSMQQLSDFMS
ncbi:glycerate dehydrogenase [Marinomonas sp. SBI22]|uniref:D-2-hydroxyacid dehydrogenase n=1 Tax=unclassified Marinomonas TaxID=196814 RepID=UPI0007AFB702|nr:MULTISPECIES: D-2-hydroxyacid dehydrogenase [unclassified Marinomonas]KZM44947.1 glycerate dehydrogenase [Marinomonas sp. SBI22]KZM46646.1 glycerate dehydrogenase [Marinomonas sp. SBI8L]